MTHLSSHLHTLCPVRCHDATVTEGRNMANYNHRSWGSDRKSVPCESSLCTSAFSVTLKLFPFSSSLLFQFSFSCTCSNSADLTLNLIWIHQWSWSLAANTFWSALSCCCVLFWNVWWLRPEPKKENNIWCSHFSLFFFFFSFSHHVSW